MSESNLVVDVNSLPEAITPGQAVAAAFPNELNGIVQNLQRGLSVLVECDKEMSPFVFIQVRDRILREQGFEFSVVDGRVPPGEQGGPAAQMGFMAALLGQLRNAVRGAATERRVIAIPHLDLMVTGSGQLTTEAREAIALMYENPNSVWLGFKDPTMDLPEAIKKVFPKPFSLTGIPRDSLVRQVTKSESRKFGKVFNPWALYKHVSGMNPVRLRSLLSRVDTQDLPNDPKPAYDQLRAATCAGAMTMPDIDLDTQIGGYKPVKDKIKNEILVSLAARDNATTKAQVKFIEGLIPRGAILYGPPGTGKTLFGKAIATALGAAVQVVSGPEIKSKWVGESEENLRRIFYQARQSAPSVIIFDELDSIAPARGTYQGSGVEHSIVNQLLTEMDGFRKEELVFVIGTTNFPSSLDPALLRPGRFEFQLFIPYPKDEDRREILKIYNTSMELQMDAACLEVAVKRTKHTVPGSIEGARWSGDHLNGLCRALARRRLREKIEGPTTSEHVDRVIADMAEKPKLTTKELKHVAVHECGHAVVSLFCEHAEPIERISIDGSEATLGFVEHKDPAHKFVITQTRLEDELAILLGGRAAEKLVLKDQSVGATSDLSRAHLIAREMVVELGMDDPRYTVVDPRLRISEGQATGIDEAIASLISTAETRAMSLVKEHRGMLDALCELLMEKKVIDSTTLKDFSSKQAKKVPKKRLAEV